MTNPSTLQLVGRKAYELGDKLRRRPMTNPSTLQPPVYQAPSADQSPSNPRHGVFALGFAAAAVVVTVLSIFLATIAPSFNSSTAPTAPAGWSTVYDADLMPGETEWPNTSGCALENQGLHVTGQDNVGIACTFQPSRRQDLLGNGFLLNLSLAPGANVASLEEAVIVLGDSGEVRVDQFGHVAACTPTCSRDSNSVTSSAFAWHGYAANTITLRWLGGGDDLEIYTNGQRTLAIAFEFGNGSRLLLLGTPKQDEAVYTHMTLRSGG
jgi:hypothetical protein